MAPQPIEKAQFGLANGGRAAPLSPKGVPWGALWNAADAVGGRLGASRRFLPRKRAKEVLSS
jgi:hypothetical protein